MDITYEGGKTFLFSRSKRVQPSTALSSLLHIVFRSRSSQILGVSLTILFFFSKKAMVSFFCFFSWERNRAYLCESVEPEYTV